VSELRGRILDVLLDRATLTILPSGDVRIHEDLLLKRRTAWLDLCWQDGYPLEKVLRFPWITSHLAATNLCGFRNALVKIGLTLLNKGAHLCFAEDALHGIAADF
jgi:hypothetical protein